MTASEDTDLNVVETETPPEDEALSAPKYEIFSYPADMTLKGYREQWENKQLVVPDFQREYIWDQVRASKLIESFLLGLPVPPVFLFRSADKKAFLVIDGQQRIRSAIYYQQGLLADKKFKLKGVDTRWDGKSFDQLQEDERFSIETAVLRAIVIQQTNPKDTSSIYHIFERLNTGGVRLNPMEVRNCVNSGSFLKELHELNKDKNWRSILGLEVPDKRFKDVELILRVLALHSDFENYEKPMKGFLNEYAGSMSKKLPEDYRDLLSQFKSVCLRIITDLGVRPFHLRGRLNYSVLDAVMVAAMKSERISSFSESYKGLLADGKFEESFSFNTSDESVLKPRLRKAIDALN